MKRFRFHYWVIWSIFLVLFQRDTCDGKNYGLSDLPPCPRRWVTIEDSCYWFEHGAVAKWNQAFSNCRQIGAKLVSLNNENETEAVAKHLKSADYTRKDWFTSGIFLDGAWEWQGDGSHLTFPFWSDSPESQLKKDYIAFTYHQNSYRWKSVPGSKPLPYICEVSRLSLWEVYKKSRRPEFLGANPEAVFDKPHHPIFFEEPENVVYYGKEGPKQFVSLKCRAFGWPTPEVEWFKGAGGIRVELFNNKQALQADGSLIFTEVTAADFGSYYCVASNKFGSVRSRRIVLNHAYTKEFPANRLDIYATAGIGKAIPCEEPDHFPQSLGYGWMFESVKKFVRESARVYISHDGTLYFSYLLSEDETSYSCNIVSSELQTGHYGPFFNLKVSKAEAGVAKRFAPKIPEEFIKINPPEPQIGRDVRLECFAYARPAPTYAWTRRNGNLPMKSRLRNYGRVLYIPEFEADDVGVYECNAKNKAGSASRSVTLDFMSRPTFVTDLKNQFREANSSVVFLCKAFGRPEVEYEWFYNGSPISPLLLSSRDQDRIVVDQNRLMIMDLKPRDAGVYQCLASNSLGQEMSSGYLSVKNFRPSFAKQVQSKVQYGMAGETVDVLCDVEASPKPTISWRKNGFPVSYNSRLSLEYSGSLRIADSTTADSGDYTCTATNEYGSDTESVVLNILADNLKLEMTDSLSVSAGENRTLVCQLKNACSRAIQPSCPEFAYSWTYNGESVDFLPQFRYGYSINSGEMSEFPLTSVSAVHSGTYMCRVDFAAGHLSQSFSVVIKTVPLSPVRVRVRNPTRNSVKLSWKLPVNAGRGYEEILDAYRIEAMAGNDTEWHVVSERLNTFHSVVDDFELVGLRPFTEYKFRVLAHNREGWSAPSVSSQSIVTESSKPTVAVTGVTVSSPNVGDILLMWEPLPQDKWGDDHLGYVVEWEEVNNKSNSIQHQNKGDSKNSVSLGMGASPSYVIRAKDLNSSLGIECRVFRVTVFPFNSHGRGPMAGPFQLGVSHSVPKNFPGDFAAKSVNSTHIQFSWTWNHSTHAGCESLVSSFKVSCASEEVNCVNQMVYSNEEDTNVTLGAFHPNVLYECTVSAVGMGGQQGPQSALVNALTLKSAPKTAPKAVKVVKSEDERQLNLHWTEVENQLKVQEPITGYKLFLFHGGSASASQEFDIPVSLLHSPSYPTVRLRGLKSLQLYRAQIGAYSKGGLGPLSEPFTFRFGLNSGSGAKFDLRVVIFVQFVMFCCLFV